MWNFMLISKMHTSVYLFCRFFELWPVLGRKRPDVGKSHFRPYDGNNSKGYFDLQVFWEYILIVGMDLSRFPWFETKKFCKMDLIKLFSPYFHTFSIEKRPRTEISLTTLFHPYPDHKNWHRTFLYHLDHDVKESRWLYELHIKVSR